MRISQTGFAAILAATALAASPAICAPIPAAQGLDAPQPGWLSPAQLREKLGATEYSRTSNFHRDGNFYVGDAIRDGQLHHLKIDPKDGSVVQDRTDKNP